jgi:serine/threonine-protein kinase
MGTVWVADHTTLGCEVAVKFVKAAPGREALRRFVREARVAAKLNHPHTVRVFDHGTLDDETPFIVMELLDGTPLDERLAAGEPLTLTEVGALVSQVGGALAEAHRLGVAHRDIKPANLFVTRSGRDMFVKVLDFGIARSADDDTIITAEGTAVGTPLYMSPEQLLDGKPGDERSDRWGLAVVAYEALTGRPPFEGATRASLGAALQDGSFAPASALREDVSGAVDAWFARALARDPDERFSSVEDMAEAFERVLDGHSTGRGKPGSRAVAVVALVGLAAVAGIAVVEGMGRAGGSATVPASAEPASPPDSVAAPRGSMSSAEPIASTASPAPVAKTASPSAQRTHPPQRVVMPAPSALAAVAPSADEAPAPPEPSLDDTGKEAIGPPTPIDEPPF